MSSRGRGSGWRWPSGSCSGTAGRDGGTGRGAQGNPSLGITAAALAVGALILGKLLIPLFALQPMIEDEMLGNQEAVNVAYFLDMAHRRAFSPELQAALPEVVWSDSTLLSDS